nr:hypothetical protein [Bacillus atrophaeus]
MNTQNTSHIILKSSAHLNRTVGGIRTSDINHYNEAIFNGCGVQEITYVLRYPEVMLCDLSNPEFPLSLCDTGTIIECYSIIEKKLQQVLKENLRVSKIVGDGLLAEIAICGPSKIELRAIKDAILKEVYEEININSKIVSSLYNARGIQPIRDFDTISENAREIYLDLAKEYKKHIYHDAIDKVKIFNLKNVYQNHLIWSLLHNLGGAKLFILTAGLSMALGYINSTDDTLINFIEVHRENDPYSLYRISPFEKIYPTEFDSDTVVIIDKVYTGGSIKLAEEIVRKENPHIKNIIKVGLFPKAYQSIINMDYIVYAGRLIRSDEVITKINPESWHIDLLNYPLGENHEI